MATFFSIVRFVPDPVAAEAINIGLLVACGDRIEVRPLASWDRVRAFAGGSSACKDARRLIEELAEAPKLFLGIERVEIAEDLRVCLSQWTRALQFSDVRASLDPVDTLMQALEPLILVGQRPSMLMQTNRRQVVVRTIYRAMTSAFELRFERKARGLVQTHTPVAGQRTRHKIDVGVVNGSLYAGAFALSFTTDQVDRQWKDTDAVAFAVEDLRAYGAADVPLGVIMDTPEIGTEASARADALLRDMQVERVPLQKVYEWARRAITSVPEALLHH
jgi:hypothetical protein